MRLSELWVHDVSTFGLKTCSTGLALVSCAVGDLLLHEIRSGEPSGKLRAHKSNVLAVTSSSEHDRLASGDVSGTVVLWKNTGEGLVKFNVTGPVRALSFNSVTHHLAAGGDRELGIWCAEKKTVRKVRVGSPVLCVKWAADGAQLMVGLMDGSVVCFDHSWKERWVSKNSRGPCWCLEAIASGVASAHWDMSRNGGFISFLSTSSGESYPFQVDLAFQPTCMLRYSDSLLLVGGTAGAVVLISPTKGVLLSLVDAQGWILSMCMPSSTELAISSSGGQLRLFRLSQQTEHGMHGTIYACRDNASYSEVIVSDLHSGSSIRVSHGSFVSKIAVYKSTLAVLSPNTVHIYKDSSHILQFTPSEPAPPLLLVTEGRVVVCDNANGIKFFTFTGDIVRHFTVGGKVRYMRVIDGVPDQESVLVGTADGSVLIVYATGDPVPVVKHSIGIRTVDINLTRSLVALVDDLGNLVVQSIASGAVISQHTNIASATFSLTHPDLLAYSTVELKTWVVRTSSNAQCEQIVDGLVVCMYGSKSSVITNQHATCNIPLNLDALVDATLLNESTQTAFRIACEGLSVDCWRKLGSAFLNRGDRLHAKKCFSQIKDYRLLDSLRDQEYPISNR